MSFESNLYSALSGEATITALVSTRIYPNKLSVGVTFPAVVYDVTSDVPITDMDGHDGYDKIRVGITAWARDGSALLSAKNVSAAVRAFLHGKTFTWSGSPIMACFLDGEFFVTAKTQEAGGIVPQGIRQDYIFHVTT